MYIKLEIKFNFSICDGHTKRVGNWSCVEIIWPSNKTTLILTFDSYKMKNKKYAGQKVKRLVL